MPMPDAPKALALILAKKKPGADMGESAPDGGGDDYVAAAQDVMDAMKSGDARAFDAALHSYIKMCMSESGE